MPLLARIHSLLRNLTRKQRVEKDLEAELSSFQTMLEDQKGRREARLEMGSLPHLQDEVRDVRLGASLDMLAMDFRHSLRGLRRNPALTILGALMLALGIGSSTVMFSIFYTTLLQPMPFREPGRLVELWESHGNITQASFSEANFWDVRSMNQSFEEVAAYHHEEANLTGEGAAEKVTASRVTAGFFRTLGVAPIIGHDFSYSADRADTHEILLGHRFWSQRFGSEPTVLGKTLRIDDQAYTVIGVLPAGRPWIDDQIYRSFSFRSNANRGSWEFGVVGRLRPGISEGMANADLQRIGNVLSQTWPGPDKGMGIAMGPSSAWIASPTTRRALWVLLGAVTFLLLIACLNIANLLLARGTARAREIAVRTALGASRPRLMRFVMLESLTLSVLGALLGLGISYGVLQMLQKLEIRGVPSLEGVGLNPWVLTFAIGSSLLTALLAGIAPSLQAPLREIATALRDGDRQAASRTQGQLRSVLVAIEVALSFLLLTGAGLLMRSFTNLTSVNPGFQTENRLVFTVSMPGRYYQNGVGKQFLNRLWERVGALPEVIAVGGVSHRPLGSSNPGMAIDAYNAPKEHSAPWSGWRVVSPGYFRAVGLPLVRGRLFDENDRPVWRVKSEPPSEPRVIISQRLAKLIFPNQDPIGQHVGLWRTQGNSDAVVVGVVGDSRERGLGSEASLTVYIAYGNIAPVSEIVVQTRGNPLASVAAIRSIVVDLDPNLPIAEIRTFDELLQRSVGPQRFNATLLAIFSGLALLLATAGIYSVLSYATARRTPEIGLRVALGASSGTILRMIMLQGMRPALAGMVAGAVGAWLLSRYMATLLFEITPLDLPTYGAVTVLLLVTGLVACYIPGVRAMRTDPTIALRAD